MRGKNQNLFIDPDGYKRFVDQYEKGLHEKLEAQKKAAASSALPPE